MGIETQRITETSGKDYIVQQNNTVGTVMQSSDWWSDQAAWSVIQTRSPRRPELDEFTKTVASLTGKLFPNAGQRWRINHVPPFIHFRLFDWPAFYALVKLYWININELSQNSLSNESFVNANPFIEEWWVVFPAHLRKNIYEISDTEEKVGTQIRILCAHKEMISVMTKTSRQSINCGYFRSLAFIASPKLDLFFLRILFQIYSLHKFPL